MVRSGTRGFTLTELLVSTAIFAIIMSAIAALFVASLRAVRTGYQSQEAFETIRGAFGVVERDLNTAFTSRDFGEYYQFYGNAYGMTLVGLLRANDQYATLGRVTYAIVPVVVKDNTGAFRVIDPFAYELRRESSVGLGSSTRPVTVQVNNAGVVDTFDLGVAALVRYIEPGVSDLDTYPFVWEDLIAFEEAEFGSSRIKAELDGAIAVNGIPANSSNPDVLARLDSKRHELLQAKKRDLWIRLIAAQEYWLPLLNGATPLLPNIWEEGLRFDFSTGNPLPVNPRDFVVAENIALFTVNAPHTAPLRPYNVAQPLASPSRQQFFEYGRVPPDTIVDVLPVWNGLGCVYDASADGLDNNGDGEIDEPAERVMHTLADGIDNDGDGLIDFADLDGEFMPDCLPFGSPLTPRIPEVVLARLPFAYNSAWLTAPPFERRLEQLIDVPSAFTRSSLDF